MAQKRRECRSVNLIFLRLEKTVVQFQTGTLASAQIVQGALATAFQIGVKGNSIATGIRRNMLWVRVESKRPLLDTVQHCPGLDTLIDSIAKPRGTLASVSAWCVFADCIVETLRDIQPALVHIFTRAGLVLIAWFTNAFVSDWCNFAVSTHAARVIITPTQNWRVVWYADVASWLVDASMCG